MTELDVYIRKLLAVLDVEMDAARKELDERRATGIHIDPAQGKSKTGFTVVEVETNDKVVNFNSEAHKHAQGVPVRGIPPKLTIKGVRVV